MKLRVKSLILLATVFSVAMSTKSFGAEILSEADSVQITECMPEGDAYTNNDFSETSTESYKERIISLFPGLSSGDYLSEEEICGKSVLRSYVDSILETDVRLNKSITNYNDIKDKYVLNEVICSVDSYESAYRVADAYGGSVKNFSYGVAVITLPEYASTAQALAAAAFDFTNLPPVWPNERYYANIADETENVSKKSAKPKRQWMHAVLGTYAAWENNLKGQGVNIAIIDTGIRENHVDISANCIGGRYFADGNVAEKNSIDVNGHGSHIAGIIAADDNKRLGTGIAPDAKVCGLCAFNSYGESTAADVIRAVNYAVVDDSFDIINLSLGGYSYNDVFAKAIKTAYEKGIIVFAAAGNEATSREHYPSDYEGAFSVASINRRGRASSFSNYGENIDFAFPGEEIYSIDYEKINGYKYASGTSMSTAVASGVAALIISSDHSIENKSGSERVDAVINIMKNTARKRHTTDLGSIVTYIPKALKLIKSN